MSDRLDLLNLLRPRGPRRRRRPWRPAWDEQPDHPGGTWDEQPDHPGGTWDEQPDDPNEAWDEEPPRRHPGLPWARRGLMGPLDCAGCFSAASIEPTGQRRTILAILPGTMTRRATSPLG